MSRKSCRFGTFLVTFGLDSAFRGAWTMTLEDVRSKTGRIREYPAIPFALVAMVSLAGAFFRAAPQAVTGGPLNTGDTAWMLTATRLVLLMTPGLSFFYGGLGAPKNTVSAMLQ